MVEGHLSISLMRKVMVEQLENGYNPFDDTGAVTINIAGVLVEEASEVITQVIPSTLFIKAFRFSLTRSSDVKETVKDTESVLRKLEAAAQRLHFNKISIRELEIKHIKLILDECHRNNSRFSTKRFIKANSYLSGLFKYLVEVGASHGNMALAIIPMKEGFTEPKMFRQDDIDRIKELYIYNRPFYNFMMIFFIPVEG